jgi:adenylate kinase
MKPIIIIGPPGSGKGTQAALLACRFNIPHISTGDLLREHVQAGDDLGKAVGAVVSCGGLVPDHVMFQIVKERLAREDCKNGYILDGFPRTFHQAIWLADQFYLSPLTLDIEVSEEIILERVAKRGREDDAHIRERLREFAAWTVPAIEYLRFCTTTISINGNLSITDVYTQCELAIEMDNPNCPPCPPQPSV